MMAESIVSPSRSIVRTPSSSKRVSDASVSDTSTAGSISSADGIDRPSSLDHSTSNSRQLELQDQAYLRSEEYRQLFRLPPDELLLQDFNCALQENFLLQGHMYLFDHYICFYSNLFGFETKKIISFHEISSVRRAKAAGIFPTAIELIAGGKKYFFTSFLSRDEAFKLINDGWLQQGHGAKLITDQQDSVSGINSPDDESVTAEKAESSSQLVDGPNLIERDKDLSAFGGLKTPVEGEIEILSASDGLEKNVVEDVEVVRRTDCSSSGKSLILAPEECDAPGVPECFTMVAESKFPVKVEEFFRLFFSDNAVEFQDSFHRKCGDKDFRCTKWCPHEKNGHTREVSFEHPIKLYLGARFGSCREHQRCRVYRNSHLVVETSQEISDVPFGDYFRVEGLWQVEQDGENAGCTLRVYTHVNFSKKTMFKGKIVQSTIDECRDAYASWIELAHRLLKQKNLEIQGSMPNLIKSSVTRQAKPEQSVEHPKVSNASTALNPTMQPPTSEDVNRHRIASFQGCYDGATSIAYSIRDYIIKFFSTFKSHSYVALLLAISITMILLIMQISILVLLSRPQQVHVISRADFTATNGGSTDRGVELSLLDKQMKYLKEELHMVETLLDKMQNEHALLQLKLRELELLRRQQ